MLSKIFIKVSSREISGYCTAGACKMRVQIGIAFCIFVLISTTLAEPHEVETPTRDKKCTYNVFYNTNFFDNEPLLLKNAATNLI